MKACRVRGPAGEPGLYMCASSVAITLSSIADGKNEQQKCGEAEVLYREALLVTLFACCCNCPFLRFFNLVKEKLTKGVTIEAFPGNIHISILWCFAGSVSC